MSGSDVVRAMRERDSERLSRISTDRVAEHLIELAAADEARYPGDLDALMSVAAVTAAAGHDGVDEALLHWLESAPSPERLRLVVTMLGVMWNLSTGSRTIPAERVRELMTVRRRVALDPAIEGPYLSTLVIGTRGAGDPALRRAVREELETALRGTPELQAAVRALIRLLEGRSH